MFLHILYKKLSERSSFIEMLYFIFNEAILLRFRGTSPTCLITIRQKQRNKSIFTLHVSLGTVFYDELEHRPSWIKRKE